MNQATNRPRLGRRSCWVAASVLVMLTLVAALSGNEAGSKGALPYTPTQGEWLCLFLNTQEALMNSEHFAAGTTTLRYFYDHARPDTIRVEVFWSEGTPWKQVLLQANEAERRVTEAAKIRHWQRWVKVEHADKQVAEMPVTETLLR